MNAPAIVQTYRRPLVASLCLLFLVSSSPWATAQDDDWGLPKSVGNSSSGGSSGGNSANSGTGGEGTQELTIGDLLVYAELVSGTDPAVGSLQLDKSGDEPTEVAVPESSAEAEVVAQDLGQTVALADLDDGARLQGDLELDFHQNLDATLVAPEQALATVALLVLDDGSSTLAEMLDRVLAGQAPAGVQGHLVIGALAELDLRALTELASDAESLGSHLSVVIASIDPSGELHLSGARVATAGSSVEIVTR